MLTKAAGVRRVDPPCRVAIGVTSGKGLRRGRDGDNLFKAVLDMLQAAGVIEGDTMELVPRLELYYGAGVKGADAVFLVTVETMK